LVSRNARTRSFSRTTWEGALRAAIAQKRHSWRAWWDFIVFSVRLPERRGRFATPLPFPAGALVGETLSSAHEGPPRPTGVDHVHGHHDVPIRAHGALFAGNRLKSKGWLAQEFRAWSHFQTIAP
jgi:hypothetical protein